jgi:hypothetical protein
VCLKGGRWRRYWDWLLSYPGRHLGGCLGRLGGDRGYYKVERVSSRNKLESCEYQRKKIDSKSHCSCSLKIVKSISGMKLHAVSESRGLA